MKLEADENEIYAPGQWECPKCGFYNVKSILSTADGGMVGADIRPAEPCPNDGTTMKPVTWKTIAKSQAEFIDKLAAKFEAAEAVVRAADPSLELLRKWRESDECDCPMDGGAHICGLPNLVIVIEKLEQALARFREVEKR